MLVGQLKTEDDNILKDILTGNARLPLDNKKALAFLQGRDRDLVRVRELLISGQRPSDKRDHKPVKLFFRNDIKTTIDKHGCLVVVKRNKNTLVTRELVIIPNKMSVGLLYSLHINLKHPTKDQLQKAVETRFYISNIANKCQEVSDACTLCVSSKPIPMEVYDYKPNVVPDHPGMSFSVDIMKECSKIVVVAADNFSGSISTSFIESEKETDLRDGIVKTVTPFMSSSLSRVRVDRAPETNMFTTQIQMKDHLM